MKILNKKRSQKTDVIIYTWLFINMEQHSDKEKADVLFECLDFYWDKFKTITLDFGYTPHCPTEILKYLIEKIYMNFKIADIKKKLGVINCAFKEELQEIIYEVGKECKSKRTRK